MNKSPRTIQSVENARRIIGVLEERGGATVAEVAEEVDLTRGTVHTYMVTLKQEGFIRKSKHNVYDLNLKILDIASSIRERQPLYKHGRQEADELAIATGDVTHLAVESDGVVYVLYSSRGSLKQETPSNGSIPIHATATGKAILAKMPDDRVAEIVDSLGLRPLTQHTITEPETLFEELESIREQGYASNNQEQTMGAQTYATSVHLPNGDLAGSIAVSGTIGRFEQKDTDEVVQRLIEAANQIEVNIQRVRS
ncbi:IclR family transcriptional regulator [Salinigranum salinum]|uniref:IclR family transcriptional regulator n=1 Tax=Salinigranum salinum TaxID=1364937 RepID=UPI001260F03D|nr:IclR family transcriptional regulator [Salinigranum salinum]